MRRLSICSETAASCGYWQNWLESKGFKHEVLRGMLWRLLDDAEWSAYLWAIQPAGAAA